MFEFGGEVQENTQHDYLKQALKDTINNQPHFTLSQQVITALDILPKLREDGLPESSAQTSTRSNATVYSVLNKCRTVSGQRLLSYWLRNPLMSKPDIDKRLNIVKYLVENNRLRSTCHDDYLRKLPDLLRLACKISKEKCHIHDLVKIYNTCKAGKSLVKVYHSCLDETPHKAQDVDNLFEMMNQACDDLTDFNELLDESIVLDQPDENNDYLLKPGGNVNIAQITDELDTLCKKARRELHVVAEDVGLEASKSIKLEIDAERGFDIRVTRQNEQAVRGNSRYIQSSTVKKDGFRFTTKTLTKLSDRYIDAKREYMDVARDVYQEIISKAVMYDEQVLRLTMAFTILDVFVALSTAALNNYAKPLILDSECGKIDIEKLRHPCAENQPDLSYVPNDILMDAKDKKFFVVTGPNMGGKSTYLKSVAIGVIMAQCGSMIPADDAKISIIDGVFTRIGAGDRQAEGVSTFMDEMLDVSQILKAASEHSLVVVDELGRGTSTFDGFGIAWSISHHIATEIKSYCLFATHFHEITELEREVNTVGNLHVKAVCHDDQMTMMYTVENGVCDESYGINVAKYTKFPDHVIADARKKLQQFEEVPGFSSKQDVRSFVRECVSKILTKQS